MSFYLHAHALALRCSTAGLGLGRTRTALNEASNPLLDLFSKEFTSYVDDIKIIALDSAEVDTEADASSIHDSSVIRLIDTGSGWGSGEHPTTAMCMKFVNEYIKSGDTFLDYGTGSGILSILACKKGATKCVAVDIDEDTIAAASRNVAINGYSDFVDVTHTKVLK